MIGLGSTTQLGIGIAIKLHDQFSGTANKINRSLLNMRKNANSALVGAITDYRNRAAIIAGGAALLTKGMADMAQQGADFQHRINQVAIVGGRELGKTRKELTEFANQMSDTFKMDPTQIAAAMFENTKAGLTKGMEEVTKYQIATSKATDEALAGEEGVAMKLLGILNSNGLKAMDVYELAGKKMTQFARIANLTTATANATMSSVAGIGESMEYFGNTGFLSGMKIEQQLALVGKLSQMKIQGSAAGTALNNMTQQLINSVGQFATPKKTAAWAALGIDPKQVESMVNSGKIFDVLQLVDSAFSKMTRVQKITTANTLFNMRGQRGALNAFVTGEKSLGDIEKSQREGVMGDLVMKQSSQMMNDLMGDMSGFGAQLKRFKNAFVESVGPMLRRIVQFGSAVLGIVTSIMATPVGKVFGSLVAIAIPVVGILFAFRAAVLTATLALRGFATSSSVGGFSGLLRGGLGMLGGSMYGGVANQVGKNAAGRFFVRGGQTLGFGGKTYKGGQVLPSAWVASMGANWAGSAGVMGGIGSKALSFLGKAGPWIGKIASFGMRWLPVIGWIWTGIEVLKMIKDLLWDDSNSKNVDRNTMSYLRDLDSQYFGYAKSDAYYKKGGMSATQKESGRTDTWFSQQVQLNVDGQNMMNKTIKNNMDNNMNNQFNFEIPGGH